MFTLMIQAPLDGKTILKFLRSRLESKQEKENSVRWEWSFTPTTPSQIYHPQSSLTLAQHHLGKSLKVWHTCPKRYFPKPHPPPIRLHPLAISILPVAQPVDDGAWQGGWQGTYVLHCTYKPRRYPRCTTYHICVRILPADEAMNRN